VAYPNDVARDNLYTSPFSAVPPPPNLDDGSHRKGGKGKGAHLVGFEQEPFQAKPDGLIASNVPAELNTLDALNRHFRQFGEVLKITVQSGECKAFVQFAESSSADNAASAVVLGRPEITLAWAQRESKGKAKGKGRERPTHLEKPAEHRVLCSNPDEQRRMDECKRKRDEISSRRTALLANLTEQLKKTMSKLNEANVPESKQEALRAIVLQIKEKMNSLSGSSKPFVYDDAPSKDSGKSEGKHADGGGKGNPGDGGRWTLDLRPKALRVKLKESCSIERLREELTKVGATEDKIVSLVMEDSSSSGQQAESDTATVHFKDRRTAELVFNQKGELPFSFEWCNSAAPPATKEPSTVGTSADTSVEAKSEQTAPDDASRKTAEATAAVPAIANGDAPVDTVAPVSSTPVEPSNATAPVSVTSVEPSGTTAPVSGTSVDPSSTTADVPSAKDAVGEVRSVDGATDGTTAPEVAADFRVDLSEEED